MGLIKVRERYNNRLPATPCTDEMKASIVQIAESEGVAIAEVMRSAVGFFLSSFVSKSDEKDNNVIITDGQAQP